MQSVSKEKELTAAQLAEREAMAKKLEEEKKHLEQETSHLKDDLMVGDDTDIHTEFLTISPILPSFLQSLEEQSKQLEQEKISAAER